MEGIQYKLIVKIFTGGNPEKPADYGELVYL